MARSLTTKQKYWLNHIQAYEAAGGNISVYAAKHQLKVKQFYAARSAHLDRKSGIVPGAPKSFQKVERSRRATSPEGISITVKGETIRFSELPPPQWLALFINAVVTGGQK